LKLHELADNTFCVFFRNNHFSTLLKHKGEVRRIYANLYVGLAVLVGNRSWILERGENRLGETCGD
jgi:hypothetical protein